MIGMGAQRGGANHPGSEWRRECPLHQMEFGPWVARPPVEPGLEVLMGSDCVNVGSSQASLNQPVEIEPRGLLDAEWL
jgi:hypothetical protein